MNDEKKDKKKQKWENKLQELHKKLQKSMDVLMENPEFRKSMDEPSRKLQQERIQSFLSEFESKIEDDEETYEILKKLMKDPDFRKDIIESEKKKIEQAQKEQEEEFEKSLKWIWIVFKISLLTLLNSMFHPL